uniref:Uncharacterized protein n=1 Tax=Parascaris univalens TaxID=6257 RepID=A0A915A9B6_PARUN
MRALRKSSTLFTEQIVVVAFSLKLFHLFGFRLLKLLVNDD